MFQSKKWFGVALLNFFIAGSFGVLLRFAFVTEISWLDFRNMLHGHSHVAMLGWLYLGLYLLLIRSFSIDSKHGAFYSRLFLATEVTVIGMSIAFPLQGYGPAAIAFSTLHVFLSYIFAFRFIRDTVKDGRISTIFARTALSFMVISTLALFALPIIVVTNSKASALYYMAVQFFLHFQFNGWFIFAALALVFRHLESTIGTMKRSTAKRFYWLLVISCFMTYALAVTWATPSLGLFVTNSLGVMIQLIALFYFLKVLRSYMEGIWLHFSKNLKVLLGIALFSFLLKVVVQAAVVVPYIATVAYTIRNYVVGFIHLILLATITFVLLALAEVYKYLDFKNGVQRLGVWMLTCGILLSELLLFVQGTMFWGSKGFLPFYYEALFAVSLLMPFGVLLILLNSFKVSFQKA